MQLYKKMNNNEKVMGQFFLYPAQKFHIRELARITKLNPNTIINVTKALIKENIIIRKKSKPLVSLYANVQDKKFIIAKRIHNIQSMYDSGLVDFLVSYYNSPEAIVVIGSYSKGEDTESSDIDIVIITNKKEIADLSKFESKLKRSVHLLPLSYKEMSDEFYNSLINGIILYGYLRTK